MDDFTLWEAFVAAEIDTQMEWWDAEGRAMPRTKTGEHVLAFAAACGATEGLRRLKKRILAQVDGRRMAETGTGSWRSPTSPVVASSDDAPTPCDPSPNSSQDRV